MDFYAEKFVIFLLVFIRTVSMFATAPLYGNQGIPGQLKIWTAAFFAYAIFPLIASGSPAVSLDLGSLIILAVQEAVMGSAIGFSLGIIFHGVIYAGDLFGIVMGFSISSVIDRQNGFDVPVIGQFEYVMAIFIFLILNGHLFLIQALKMSYVAVPISGLKISAAAVNTFVHLTGMVFSDGSKNRSSRYRLIVFDRHLIGNNVEDGSPASRVFRGNACQSRNWSAYDNGIAPVLCFCIREIAGSFRGRRN